MRSTRVVVSAVTGTLLFGVLAFTAEPRPVRLSYNHFTDGDEERIGTAMAQKIEKEGIPVPGPDGRPETAHIQRNMLLETYLESIASKLGQASQRSEIPYTVRVINAPHVANAMSIPGGHIYIYSGLLEFVQTEGELSAVLSHRNRPRRRSPFHESHLPAGYGGGSHRSGAGSKCYQGRSDGAEDCRFRAAHPV